MIARLSGLLILLVALGLILPADAAAEFTSLPTGFEDQPVASGVPAPTAIDWLPNGDLLVASQNGVVTLVSEGDPNDAVLDLGNPDRICTNANERGLLGLAVDPGFAVTPYIYVYYTRESGNGCANRVSRFTQAGDGSFGDEFSLIASIPSPNGNHNGGDLQFDNDGLLYVSVGDGGSELGNPTDTQDDNSNARRRDILLGKILRIKTDGSIPAGNPFQGPGTRRCAGSATVQSEGRGVQAERKNRKERKQKKRKKRKNRKRGPVCQEIFATGLRNPFRIAFDPNDTTGAQRFYINDVGGNGFEEIDDGSAGADYGWNLREGPCPTGQTSNCSPDPRFEEPVFAYRRNGASPFNGCRTITGGAFVPNDWATDYSGVYFFADLYCERLFALRDEGPGEAPEVFATAPEGAGAIHLAFGPDGALYYTTFEGGGQVRKIVDQA